MQNTWLHPAQDEMVVRGETGMPTTADRSARILARDRLAFQSNFPQARFSGAYQTTDLPSLSIKP